MSGGGGASSGQSSSYGESTFVESQLSKEQAKILKKREEQYQEYFFPEIINQLEESKKPANQSALFAKTASGIESGAKTAKTQLAQSMAQRGISDGGSAAAGELSIEQAKGASLAEAYFNSQLQNEQKTLSILQMGGALSPTPTTAAPVGSNSTNSAGSKNSAWNMNMSMGS